MRDLLGQDPRYLSPETLARHANTRLILCRLIFAVADNDEENIRLIRGDAKDEDTVRQRHSVILVARLHCGAGLEEIGRALNMDHSAVQRAVGNLMQRYLEDPEFRTMAGRLTMQKCSFYQPDRDEAA